MTLTELRAIAHSYAVRPWPSLDTHFLTSQPGPRTDLHLVPSVPTSPILPMCSFNHERAPDAGSLGSRPGFRVTSRLRGAHPDQRRWSWRFHPKKGCILGESCMGAGVQERWRLAWKKSICGRLWSCLVWPVGERGGVRGGASPEPRAAASASILIGLAQRLEQIGHS